jgi:7,8-dihydropterin-6-yl-methyl-4-(beta-D-ribofuranosyl)aminobenzene 5'-phosphate synthase
MRITIIYDNRSISEQLHAGWGFACIITAEGMPHILFDTGYDGPALFDNMAQLGFDPESIDVVFISHGHLDHTGGLQDFVNRNTHAAIFVPASMQWSVRGSRVTPVKKGIRICDHAYSTGELAGIEQSLVLDNGQGLVVVTGCSHPGVGAILEEASKFGEVHALVGGFHGFSDLSLLRDLDLVCPCHCTQHLSEIERLYPDKCVQCGAGAVIEL